MRQILRGTITNHREKRNQRHRRPSNRVTICAVQFSQALFQQLNPVFASVKRIAESVARWVEGNIVIYDNYSRFAIDEETHGVEAYIIGLFCDEEVFDEAWL